MTVQPNNPGWVLGQVPTPAQWNAEWASKQDWPSGIPDANTAFNVSIPTTGGTVTSGVGLSRQILNPAGTLATLTVNLPASPVNGQIFRVSSTQIIMALTLATTDATSVVGAPTTISAHSAIQMIYDSTGTTWYPG